jgi:RHS repeat-associated protein
MTIPNSLVLGLVGIIDAIGQVTTLTYGLTNDIYKVTQVTDPFGRFATFAYDSLGRLTNITDVIGMSSRFIYLTTGDFISNLITPYGSNSFTTGGSGTTRFLETVYADGSRDRVEFNQTITQIPMTDLSSTVPLGMATLNNYLQYRNTYYWSRAACASSYGDYTKARIYHWLHTADGTSASGILESVKEPLENRVWYDYPGQNSGANVVGASNKPLHVGRVLDDGSTQLYTYAYNGFGHPTNTIDPVGRTFSYIYDTNGVDLLEVRQTRAGNNELLARTAYNAQHLPLTSVDAAGQTNSYTYNTRGQLLMRINPRTETTTYSYDPDGYLLAVDGPLPGTSDTATGTYDGYGRIRTKTDVSGYTLTFDYDALDHLTQITHPDGTFEQIIYDRLDPSVIRDRAGRQTLLEHDSIRQLTKRTDALGRVTLFQWCSCGDIKSLTDAMGRTTTWHKDVQNRLIAKQYGDGSQATYTYENTSSRLRQVVDEKLQTTTFTYNADNTPNSVTYGNCAVATPGLSFSYDTNYARLTSMTDGVGTTLYQYVPITTPPLLGAGALASETGPLPNVALTCAYDELGRRTSTAVNNVASLLSFDAAGRVIGETNALGTFSYAYDGASSRILLEALPNSQTTTRAYDDNPHDRALQRITHQFGATPISQFVYGRDIPAGRIVNWSQQFGAASPNVYSFSYDVADQLLSATVTNAGVQVNNFAYSYDPNGNRLSERAGNSTVTATYNALNELNTTSGGTAMSRTNEWDGRNRLTVANSGNQRVEFTYDGLDRLASIRLLTNGVEASFRRFVWCGSDLWEERDGSGGLTKRFFEGGVRIETGASAGSYFYTRDHLGSIRELIDGGGSVRASYAYDPFGRRTRTAGDLDTDFGFAGMFWSYEAGLNLTHFRAYEPELGRWLSRDPLRNAETEEGANLYWYVANDPINATDRLGLSCEDSNSEVCRALLFGPPPPRPPDRTPVDKCCRRETKKFVEIHDKLESTGECGQARRAAWEGNCSGVDPHEDTEFFVLCSVLRDYADKVCEDARRSSPEYKIAAEAFDRCESKPCKQKCGH